MKRGQARKKIGNRLRGRPSDDTRAVIIEALRDAQGAIIGYLLIGTELKAGALQSAIFNSANFSSIATDAKGVIQIFNVGAERMLGYAAAEVMNKITPADISDPQELIARAKALSVELGTPITPGFEALVFKASRGIEDIYELTYIRKDGSRFPAVVSVTALRDAQGAIIGYLLIGTELKAGALQSAIFNSANFSSIATDAKGVIQIFNVGAERMLGYAAAEVMNKITPADISDPQELIAHAKALSGELGTPITPGFEALVFKASRGIEDIYELTYIRKDGSRFPAVVSVTALRDAQNAIIGYLLIGTDNTARKQIEAEQRKLDQRLRDQQFYTRSLIESNIDALATIDPVGIVTDVNKQMEALTGCTRDELIGAPFKSYFTDPERAEAAIKLVLSEKKVTDYELTVCARDGKQTVVSYNATTFYDRGRTLQGVFAAARDVTERKRLERLKDEFVSMVSHELRTPMTSIAGALGLLMGNAAGPLPDAAARLLTIAHANSQRLVRLINDILDIQKIESGQVVFHLRHLGLRALIEQTIEANRAFAQGFGVSIRLDDASADGEVFGDADRIAQIVTNLLSNAVKFSSGGDEVVVTIERRGENMRISVRDHGPGIPEEFKPRIFEKFAQADSSDARQKGGTGLGLSIVKQLVHQHGGTVGFEPAPGGGTIFHCELPRSSDPAVTGRAPRAGGAEPLVLVCCNSPAPAALGASLREVGFAVEAGSTVAGARAHAAATPYAALLIDLQLPDLGGMNLIHQFRAMPRHADTPIILISIDPARTNADPRSAALCVCDWLDKPTDGVRLVQIVNRAIARVGTTRPRILLVEPDGDLRHLIQEGLRAYADITATDSADGARGALAKFDFDLAVLDLASMDDAGLDLLAELHDRRGHAVTALLFSANDPALVRRVSTVLARSRMSIDRIAGTLLLAVARHDGQTRGETKVA
jgi:PAS domain S-box-containing protein